MFQLYKQFESAMKRENAECERALSDLRFTASSESMIPEFIEAKYPGVPCVVRQLKDGDLIEFPIGDATSVLKANQEGAPADLEFEPHNGENTVLPRACLVGWGASPTEAVFSMLNRLHKVIDLRTQQGAVLHELYFWASDVDMWTTSDWINPHLVGQPGNYYHRVEPLGKFGAATTISCVLVR
jgi:hypothetical protein